MGNRPVRSATKKCNENISIDGVGRGHRIEWLAAPNHAPAVDLGRRLGELWNDPQFRKFTYIGGGIVVLSRFLHSCV